MKLRCCCSVGSTEKALANQIVIKTNTEMKIILKLSVMASINKTMKCNSRFVVYAAV